MSFMSKTKSAFIAILLTTLLYEELEDDIDECNPFNPYLSPSSNRIASHIRSITTMDEIEDCLGGPENFKKAYKMTRHTFNHLLESLKPTLYKIFYTGATSLTERRGKKTSIPIDIRLSVAIRYFAGTSVYDLCLAHGISITSVNNSVWGVVDSIHLTESLNTMFPSYDEQSAIASEFAKMSGAGLQNCTGALDGILIWTKKPSKALCRQISQGEKTFYCDRKKSMVLTCKLVVITNYALLLLISHFPPAHPTT